MKTYGQGSTGTLSWQDDKAIDKEKQKRKTVEAEEKIKGLEKEKQDSRNEQKRWKTNLKNKKSN